MQLTAVLLGGMVEPKFRIWAFWWTKQRVKHAIYMLNWCQGQNSSVLRGRKTSFSTNTKGNFFTLILTGCFYTRYFFFFFFYVENVLVIFLWPMRSDVRKLVLAVTVSGNQWHNNKVQSTESCFWITMKIWSKLLSITVSHYIRSLIFITNVLL